MRGLVLHICMYRSIEERSRSVEDAYIGEEH